MQCPRTTTTLKEVKVGGISVFISESCGGVFFDNQQIKNFERPEAKRGDALANHLRQFQNSTLDEQARVSCPKCPDTVMLRRFYSPLHVVEIDECPSCGGIWLDTGELDKLRSLFMNDKERALLRAQLISETRPANVKGLSHLGEFHSTHAKVDKLLDTASYLLELW